MAGSLHLAGIAKVTGIIIHPLSTSLFLSSHGAPCYVAPIKAILLLNPRYCNFLWPKRGGKRKGRGRVSRETFLVGAIRRGVQAAPAVVARECASPPLRFPAFTFKTHFSPLRFPDVFEIEFHRSPIRTTGGSYLRQSLPRYCEMRRRFIKIAFTAVPALLPPVCLSTEMRPINERESEENEMEQKRNGSCT